MWIRASSHATHLPFIQILLALMIAIEHLAREGGAPTPSAPAMPPAPGERFAGHGAGCGASTLRMPRGTRRTGRRPAGRDRPARATPRAHGFAPDRHPALGPRARGPAP